MLVVLSKTSIFRIDTEKSETVPMRICFTISHFSDSELTLHVNAVTTESCLHLCIYINNNINRHKMYLNCYSEFKGANKNTLLIQFNT